MLLVVVGLTTEGCPSNVESDNTKKGLNAVKRMIYLGNAKQYIQHPCRMQGEVQIKLPRAHYSVALHYTPWNSPFIMANGKIQVM